MKHPRAKMAADSKAQGYLPALHNTPKKAANFTKHADKQQTTQCPKSTFFVMAPLVGWHQNNIPCNKKKDPHVNLPRGFSLLALSTRGCVKRGLQEWLLFSLSFPLKPIQPTLKSHITLRWCLGLLVCGVEPQVLVAGNFGKPPKLHTSKPSGSKTPMREAERKRRRAPRNAATDRAWLLPTSAPAGAAPRPAPHCAPGRWIRTAATRESVGFFKDGLGFWKRFKGELRVGLIFDRICPIPLIYYTTYLDNRTGA